MSFPLSPANNQVTLENGISYTYNASRNFWYRTPSTALSAITSNTFTVLNSIIFSDGTSQATAANPTDAYARTTANTASNNITIIQGVNTTQNTNITIATDAATGAFAQANATAGGLTTANGRMSIIEGVDTTQNTNITTADTKAQAAFDSANTKLATSGGTITGNLIVNAVTANTITANGTNLGTAVAEAFLLANNAAKSTTSNTAPANPKVGDSWFDTVTNVLLRYTNDGVSNNWIDISGPQNAGYIYQSYALTPNTSTINETTGNTVIYTVTTTNTADNTVLYWTNSGTTVAADFSDSANSGNITIINNSGTITRSLSADASTEGSETIVLSLRTGSTTGPVVAVASSVTVGDTSQTPVGYTIDYLTVAGGGGGSDNYGGGGGAGGFISSSQTFFTGFTYTITVGAGAASTTYNPAPGTGYLSFKGSNTSIVGTQSPALSIVAFGGGAGIGGGGGNYNPAQPAGGSGGGGGYPQQAGGIAIGSPGIGVAGTQGYPGANYQGVFNGGGGGGASQAGQGQDGGSGQIWSFNNNRYAGGGGGGGAAPPGQWGGSGGLGGGGTGKNQNNLGPGQNAGEVNTGGGGGGGANFFSSPSIPGAGGSGVVLLAVPNAQYPGVSAPGATVTTPPAAPGRTVLTYTSSGTFTA